MFQVGVTVSTVGEPARSFTDRFRVHTRALYTFIPEDRLHAIGVEPLRSRELLLADGRRDRRLMGEAKLAIEGLEDALTCQIIFAPAGSLCLLGATALEAFGVAVDPVSKRLKPILAIIGGFLGSRPRDADEPVG